MQTKTAHSYRYIVSTGLAMFSMFFGAGNIVFPLMLGQMMGDSVWMGLAGFLIAAVGVPFAGLLSMVLFEGNYQTFFNRLGELPAALLIGFILIIIGPVNAIPRCITLSYGTMKLFFPSLSLFLFSLVSCIIIFMLTVRKNKMVDVLGEFLSPLLVVSLAVIIIKGLLTNPEVIAHAARNAQPFATGLLQGYNTMDLLGTFFFSSVAIASLKMHFPQEKNPFAMARYALQASMIGAVLLGIVYIGFGIIASRYSVALAGMEPEVLLGTLAHLVLGRSGGVIVSLAVALACLTTALALVVVFSEYLRSFALFRRLGYPFCLLLTLVMTMFFASLGFSSIVAMMVPVLFIIYPALIVLVLTNIAYKWYGFKPVKTPFYITIIVSVLWYHYPVVASYAASLSAL